LADVPLQQNKKTKEKIWRQFNEKPSIISGCPGAAK